MIVNQHLTRRKFLAGLILSVPATALALKELTAAQATEIVAPELTGYQPVFFAPEEWQFILAATDRLIPAGGSGHAPGALETNVPVFIDQQLNGDLGQEMYMEGPFNPHLPATKGYQIPYYPQQIYHLGIKLTDQWTRKKYKAPFHALAEPQKDEVLTALQKNEVNFADLGEDNMKASQFFSQLLGETRHGYLSDPMYGGNKGMKAWIAIGFPGARASFLEWVTQHNVPYPLGPVSIQGERA